MAPWWPSWNCDQNNFNFIYKSLRYLLPSFKWIGLSVQEKKQKIAFQDGRHLGVLIRMIVAIFDLQATLTLPTKFGVNWPFGSGEEAKNRFLRQRPWQSSWISDQNNFSYFWSTSHPDASYQVSRLLVFWFRTEKARNRFSRRLQWRPFFISYWNNFSYFWSPSHPDASFWDSSQLGRGPSWISNLNSFSYFWSNPDASYQVSSQLVFLFRRKSQK